jgi:hypothetical protein
MPTKIPSRADGYFDKDRRASTGGLLGEDHVFRGRIVPNIQLVRSIMRGFEASPRQNVDDLDWILRQLELFGQDEDEVKTEFEQMLKAKDMKKGGQRVGIHRPGLSLSV